MFLNALHKIVQKYPDTLAIVQGDRRVSYADLWQRALLIGGHIKQQGLGAEDVVGLHFYKSIDYLEALLGTWMAGAAFVPIDPSLPEERQEFIKKDAGVGVVLDAETIYAENPLLEPVTMQENHLAYTIYTSGSTGMPKGVMVEHAGLLNILEAQIKTFEYFAGAQALFYLSHSFDASISDIGTALLSGATLHIEPVCKLQNVSEFYDILNAKKITHIDLPPSFLKILDPAQVSASLKTLVIGGEVPDAQTVRTWSQRVNLVNVYGPTEATICTSMVKCTPNWSMPDIGAAVPHTGYSIFDEKGQPSHEGELYISGIQLARGYKNLEKLTAYKFPTIKGVRYYRTGDKVERLEDGRIVFYGRLDRQVKVRGQLVELEEIEKVLMSYPSIKRCAVIKRGVSDTALREQLVGFIQPNNAKISTVEIRENLAKKLPKWMIPYRFEILKELPQTLTGKVDSKQLKNYPLSLSKKQKLNTATEYKLADIWSIVLGVENFVSTDNFFEVGGDSLATLDLSIQAGKIGWHISPTLVADKTVLADMAAALDEGGALLQSGGMDAHILHDRVKDLLSEVMPALETASAAVEKLQNAFLTGATGFLGARMLHEILVGSEAHVFALVRAGSIEQAKERIAQALHIQNLQLSDSQWQRITPVCGDITQKYLGLRKTLWEELSQKVDTVYHCAALVNTVLPYEALEASNVTGVKHMVQFCLSGQAKHLHYASTLSVFVATDQNTGTVYESDDLSSTKVVYGGYAQTKWVSDRLLGQLQAKGFPVSLYRFGLITGDTIQGVSAKSDFINMFFTGIKKLKFFPESALDELYLDVTPCDYASSAFFNISLEQKIGTYHIASEKGASLRQLLEALYNEGITMKGLTTPLWTSKIAKISDMDPDESAAYLALCRTDANLFKTYRTMDLFQATGITFDTSQTQGILGKRNNCPDVTPELLSTYAKFSLLGEKA
ncbi:MAG: thioester reductase domain-containing protein [Alphaproteobacteria bacterium]|nr:thioester reductase domain-containing protein [Alphaproteobacteria bacterium]